MFEILSKDVSFFLSFNKIKINKKYAVHGIFVPSLFRRRRRLFNRRNLGEQSRRNGCAGSCEKRLG
jgi:hypothetical protein